MELKVQNDQLVKKVETKGKIEMGPVTEADSHYFNKPQEFLLAKCAFYECKTCKKPFYGGLVDCERDLQLNETTTKDDL